MDKFINVLNLIAKYWEIIAFILWLFGVIIALIIADIKKNIKLKKAKTEAEKELINAQAEAEKQRIIDENLVILKVKIQEFMEDAEALNADGTVKKEVVKSKAMVFCYNRGMIYNDAIVDALIEGYIRFSKTVNARDKDKTVEPVKTETVAETKL
jgi:hypothetical protein